MSHFSVIVISDQPLNEKALKPILQPWHEFECTGVRDQYVVEVDKTDEVLEEFNKAVPVLRLADGSVASLYDDQFYVKRVEDWSVDRIRREAKEMTENYSEEQIEEMVRAVVEQAERDPDKYVHLSFRPKFLMPAGAVEEQMPADQARALGIGYLTMEQCAEDYFGEMVVRDGRYYDLTNPNKKWDWWQVGGRWSGMFIPGYDPDADPANIEACAFCHGTGKRKDMEVEDGCNGCRGTGRRTKWPTQWRTGGNVAQKKDVPIEAIRTLAEERAVREHDLYSAVVAGRDFPTWDEVRRRNIEAKDASGEPRDWDLVRKEFNEHPVVVDVRDAMKANNEDHFFGLGDLMENLKLTRAERAQQARDAALCPLAFVRDGKWHERGTMGWFGVIHDEEDRASWSRDFAKMFDELPGEAWLAVVDCHI